MNPSDAYAKLLEHGRETVLLGSMGALLHWDQRTMIPPRGHAHRTTQIATLSRLLHIRRTDPAIGDWLVAVEGSELTADPRSPEAVNIREWRRTYDRAVKIPECLAVELAKLSSESETAWEKSRPANDWESFRPYLERLLALKLEVASCIGYHTEPYDALLDDYEPGETAADIEPVFGQLRPHIISLIDRIRGSSRERSSKDLARSFPILKQEVFIRMTAEKLGYDFDAGRMDVSAHPFSTFIGPGDARITTRFDENSFGSAFFSSVHEAGHAMYNMGLPPAHYGEPMGEFASLAVHESQSRLWENMVARSRGFWRHFFPIAQRQFPSLRDVSLDEFHFAVNETRPGLIRTEADELTYNLHVMLRFELELALTRGSLAVADLPEAWNERMRQYLGITPASHSVGVMQDVHWAAGYFAYFPTYSLGNVYAAQLFDKAAQDLGDLEEAFARGDFASLLSWLRDKVHSQGGRFRPHDLIRHATGAFPDPSHLVRYFEKKYCELYGV